MNCIRMLTRAYIHLSWQLNNEQRSGGSDASYHERKLSLCSADTYWEFPLAGYMGGGLLRHLVGSYIGKSRLAAGYPHHLLPFISTLIASVITKLLQVYCTNY